MIHPLYNQVTFYLTMRCNMQCVLCHQRGTAAWKCQPDATLDSVKYALRRFKQERLEFKSVTLSGGEPLLWTELAEATDLVRESGITKTIQIITNGCTEYASRFGDADVVRVTDYGASNRYFIDKLAPQLKRRLHVSPAVHVPPKMPFTKAVSCKLLHLAVMGDKLHFCCTQALHGIGGVPLSGPIRKLLFERDPRKEDICHTCMGNKHAYASRAVPMTCQMCIWGVEELNLIKRVWLPGQNTLRRAYQAFRHWRGR